jgi:biopolymer transport protein ExbD
VRLTTPRPDAAGYAVTDWLRLFAATLLFTMLVVLIFFMVVLPIRPDVPAFVDVPTARWASMSPEYEHDLTISILSDGRTYLGNVEVGVVALERRLSAARVERRETPVLRVRVDRAAAFQHVRRVVRAARNAGFPRLTFMVRQD